METKAASINTNHPNPRISTEWMATVNRILPTLIFTFMCAGSLFLTTSFFVNEQVTPKWYWTFFCSAALLLVYIVFSFFTGKGEVTGRNSMPAACLIIVTLCLLQAVYGILQYVNMFPAVNGFRVTGSFDNPAGFAASLCAGFPFLLYFVFSEKLWKRYTAITTVIVIVAAIVLSASRAGVISLIAVGLAAFFYKIKIVAKWKWTIITVLLSVSLSGLYFLKKDSADGRLLIWRCSLEMVKDKPLFGHGYGGFKAGYMNYQAEYFEHHPDSKYTILADNVNRPFNEYLLLLVNSGLFGLMVLILVFYRLWQIFKYNRSKTLFDYISYLCLLSIAVFALFSYPLTYPFVWVVGLSSIANLFYPLWRTQKRFLFDLRLIIILAVPVAGYLTYDRMRAEMKWCDIAHKSLRGRTEQMLPEYKLLYDKLKCNELFLYNYAAELNVVGQYEKSLTIAQECERLWADYDLQMLMADNYRQMQRYKDAEQHYKKASLMCPVKFMPLYELAKLYVEEWRDNEALSLANTILAKK
ncbi:MAG: O-antigen ligase family protein [Tannerella sp.]|nr:O-antigen ligase family protein [Tannerella sp.]